MFREMRRKAQLLPEAESIAMLTEATSGVLAVLGDDDYAYAVPLSHVYHDGKIYFHCAKAGHKLDAVMRHSKASFCVVGKDQVVPEKYTTFFRSVIAFGRVRVLEDAAEKRAALEVLAARFSPDHEEGRKKEIDMLIGNVALLEFTVGHMTGKEAIELVKEKQQKQA
ncbi:MAG TPA: pyridoxamine 5'-phosphate oxidase family protein [Terriglobales bacterium]|nr:pyridoxamine 5'-phosphate oxidase family protein [Terriglobales bacterium]